MRASDIRDEVAAALGVVRPRHLIHVGAHDGEEIPHYRAAGIECITVVEPIPELAARLRARFVGVEVVEAACSDANGTAVLTVPDRTNMATLVPGLDGRTIEVATRRLDEIAPDADALVLDVQGHEFAVLAAAPWNSLRVIVVETCTLDDPTLSPPYDAMTAYMADRGFTEMTYFVRDYDWIQRWAFRRITHTGQEVRDVVYVRQES